MRRYSRPSIVAVALLLAAAAILVAADLLTRSSHGTSEAAVTSGTWLPAHSLNATGEPYAATPQVAMNAQGDALAVWRYYDGSYDHVEAAYRPAGGSWSSPEAVSPSGERVGDIAAAIDSQGDSVIVWQVQGGGSSVIKASSRPAQGNFGPAEQISGSSYSYRPTVTVGPDGTMLAAWLTSAPIAVYSVEAAERPPSGSFASPVTVAAFTYQSPGYLRAALGPGGAATLLWTASYPVGPTGSSSWVSAATRAAGGTTFTTQQLDSASSDICWSPNLQAQLAMNGAGDTVATWTRVSDGSSACSTRSIQAAIRPAGGAFAAATEVSSGTNYYPTAAIDGQGNSLVAWSESGTTVKAAFRPVGGDFGGAETVASAANLPQLAMDPAGNAIVEFQNSGTPNAVYGASRPVGGSFGSSQMLSAAGRTGRVNDTGAIQLTGQGNGAVVWRETTGTANQYTIQAAGYDAAGPQLRDLSIPTQVEVGSLAQFSVSPFDVWSNIASTHWDFGDGVSASGASATHTYNQPGTYPISVTSTDAVDNSLSAGSQLSVQSANAPPAATGQPAAAAKKKCKKGYKLKKGKCVKKKKGKGKR